ncbi:hypothetical protein ATKI12_2110 [Kitasatospora sp. Ki12]
MFAWSSSASLRRSPTGRLSAGGAARTLCPDFIRVGLPCHRGERVPASTSARTARFGP